MAAKKNMVKKFILALLFSAIIPNAQAATPSDAPGRVDLNFVIYAGGFKVLNSAIDIDLTAKDYKAAMTAQPSGIIGHLLPWAGSQDSTGIVDKKGLVPVTNDKVSNWRDDRDHIMMVYKEGVLTAQKKIDTKDGKTVEQDMPFNKDWAANTTDILTAVVQMLRVAGDANNCNFSQDIYDGKRRFALKFTDQGDDTLDKSDINVFAGVARKCQIELVPEQGFTKKLKGYYKMQEDARQLGELPHVWLARLWPDGPMLPVRMTFKNGMGTVMIHLTKASK